MLFLRSAHDVTDRGGIPLGEVSGRSKIELSMSKG